MQRARGARSAISDPSGYPHSGNRTMRPYGPLLKRTSANVDLGGGAGNRPPRKNRPLLSYPISCTGSGVDECAPAKSVGRGGVYTVYTVYTVDQR